VCQNFDARPLPEMPRQLSDVDDNGVRAEFCPDLRHGINSGLGDELFELHGYSGHGMTAAF
jgi:hypothetical protein